MNKTSISSVVCFDIIDFSKKSKAEQQAAKKQFDALIDLAVVDIPEKDHLIVDTGHGAIVTCSGPLENALEDALFIALTVRDEVLGGNSESSSPLYLLIGINLGSVKVAQSANVNEEPNIIGEGLVEAQRIMSFANPNQILVSRAYYDMASKLTLEIAQMFEKYDMHAYEHDIYAVRLLSEKAATVDASMPITENGLPENETPPERVFNWGIYILPVLLAFVMLFVLTKWMQAEDSAEGAEQAEPVIELTIEETIPLTEGEELIQLQDEVVAEQADQEKAAPTGAEKKKTVKKRAPKEKVAKEVKSTPDNEPSVNKADTHESKVTPEPVSEAVVDSTQDTEKSGWDKLTDSIKSGAKTECNQAQKALNQCN